MTSLKLKVAKLILYESRKIMKDAGGDFDSNMPILIRPILNIGMQTFRQILLVGTSEMNDMTL